MEKSLNLDEATRAFWRQSARRMRTPMSWATGDPDRRRPLPVYPAVASVSVQKGRKAGELTLSDKIDPSSPTSGSPSLCSC